VFIVGSIMNAIAALMAWYVLRPMRSAEMEMSALPESSPAAVADGALRPQPAV
jgi:hypothetical protein